jgi:hypothetical protein
MAKPHYEPIVIQDAKLLFPNFAGIATQYNKPGDRNSCVLIDDDLANQLAAIGWNIRIGKSTDPDIVPGKFISFTVNMNAKFPPRLWLIRHGRRPELMAPEDFNILDFARYQSVSLKINQYIWNEKPQKVSGFLEEGFFELMPDPLRDRYFAVDGQA